MQNKFNEIENKILTFLQNDSDVSALVNYFHTKILADPAKYANHQLPAIAVHSIGYSNEDQDLIKSIHSVVEVVHRAGDLAAADDKVKEIVSLVIDKLNAESPRDGYGGGLNSPDVDDIYVNSANIVPTQLPNGFIVSGLIDVTVELIEK